MPLADSNRWTKGLYRSGWKMPLADSTRHGQSGYTGRDSTIGWKELSHAPSPAGPRSGHSARWSLSLGSMVQFGGGGPLQVGNGNFTVVAWITMTVGEGLRIHKSSSFTRTHRHQCGAATQRMLSCHRVPMGMQVRKSSTMSRPLFLRRSIELSPSHCRQVPPVIALPIMCEALSMAGLAEPKGPKTNYSNPIEDWSFEVN